MTSEEEFKTECAVPDHSGPIVSGWESNHQWNYQSGRAKSQPDGHLDPTDMGVWTDFASCLANAMRLIEGQAYAPEIKRDSWDKGKFNLVYPEMGSILDDGTESGKAKDRKPLDATIIGPSDYAQGVRD